MGLIVNSTPTICALALSASVLAFDSWFDLRPADHRNAGFTQRHDYD